MTIPVPKPTHKLTDSAKAEFLYSAWRKFFPEAGLFEDAPLNTKTAWEAVLAESIRIHSR